MTLKRSSALLGLLLLILLAVPGHARAASKGISVSPALQEVVLAADKPEAEFTFTIGNTTTDTVDLRLSSIDFGALNESGGLAFIGESQKDTTKYGLSQWMVLEKDTLTLAPGESQEVKATVPNRESLSAGGHYGAIVVTSRDESDNGKERVGLLPSASVLVLLRKTGGEISKLSLSSVTSPHSAVTQVNSTQLRFRNEGNVHVVPRGTVLLKDPRGRIVKRGIINEGSGFILPESIRSFDISLNTITKSWLPGRYNLIVNWRFDGQKTFTTTVMHVWYIGLIPLTILSIIVFVICIYFVQKQIGRKKRS